MMDKKNIPGNELYNNCKVLINTKYNRYFSAAALVDELIAMTYDIDIKIVMNSSKKSTNPFGKIKRSVRHRIIPILRKLEELGEIEKYSKTSWKKVKA